MARCKAQGADVLGEDSRAANLAGEAPAAPQTHSQAENDVPQPHDLVAWGFTKTNPCCISVSW